MKTRWSWLALGAVLLLRPPVSRASALPLVLPGEGWDVVRDERAGTCAEYDRAERTRVDAISFHVAAYPNAQGVAPLLLPAWRSAGTRDIRREVEDLLATRDPRDILFVVSAEAVATETSLVGLRLTTQAKDLLRLSPDRFRERCGDGAVRAVRTGGRYFAILRFRASSVAEREPLLQTLSEAATAITQGASFGAALDRAARGHFVSASEIRVGLRAGPTCLAFICMETTARGLLGVLDGGGLSLEREAVPYGRILDPREQLPEPVSLDSALPTVRAIRTETAALQEERQRLAAADREPALAPELDGSQRQRYLAETTARLSALTAADLRCRTSPAECDFPALLRP